MKSAIGFLIALALFGCATPKVEQPSCDVGCTRDGESVMICGQTQTIFSCTEKRQNFLKAKE